jgi:thiopurine S-methyltransferase
MESDFWLARWRTGDIGFHQPDGNELLKTYWPALGVAEGATVFVPLAGKSVDMHWLAARGHRVVGVELSELAVDQFFADAALVPDESRNARVTIKSSGLYKMLCGDIFELDRTDLDGADSAYDRAALIALPSDLRRRYADKLASLLPAGAVVLLISIDYPPGEIEGPPFSVPPSEIDELFARHFEIEHLEARDGLVRSPNLVARGVTRLDESAYLLRRRA